MTASAEDEAIRRTRNWTTAVLGCVDVGIGVWAYTQFGVVVAFGVVVVYAGFFVMAWLVYLWLLGRLN